MSIVQWITLVACAVAIFVVVLFTNYFANTMPFSYLEESAQEVAVLCLDKSQLRMSETIVVNEECFTDSLNTKLDNEIDEEFETYYTFNEDGTIDVGLVIDEEIYQTSVKVTGD